MKEFKKLLNTLEGSIVEQAFHKVRAKMGIKDISDLDILEDLSKKKVEYNKFDSM